MIRPGGEPGGGGEMEELWATDALLDRLAGRAVAGDDVEDPAVAALALLASDVDHDPVPVDETRHALHEYTLGVRPSRPFRPADRGDADAGLPYVLYEDPFAPGNPAGSADPGGAVDPVGPAAAHPGGIDLGRRRPAATDAPDSPFPLTGAATGPAVRGTSPFEPSDRTRPRRAGRPGDAGRPGRAGPAGRDGRAGRGRNRSAGGDRLPELVPLSGARRGRESDRAGHALRAGPAVGVAAAVLLLILGGGVSAVVNGGDPLGGLTRLVDYVTGEDDTANRVRALDTVLDRAQAAVEQGDVGGARKLVDSVRRQAGDLPEAAAAPLLERVEQVQAEIRRAGG